MPLSKGAACGRIVSVGGQKLAEPSIPSEMLLTLLLYESPFPPCPGQEWEGKAVLNIHLLLVLTWWVGGMATCCVYSFDI